MSNNMKSSLNIELLGHRMDIMDDFKVIALDW